MFSSGTGVNLQTRVWQVANSFPIPKYSFIHCVKVTFTNHTGKAICFNVSCLRSKSRRKIVLELFCWSLELSFDKTSHQQWDQSLLDNVTVERRWNFKSQPVFASSNRFSWCGPLGILSGLGNLHAFHLLLDVDLNQMHVWPGHAKC